MEILLQVPQSCAQEQYLSKSTSLHSTAGVWMLASEDDRGAHLVQKP